MRVWATATLEGSQCHCFMFLEEMMLTKASLQSRSPYIWAWMAKTL